MDGLDVFVAVDGSAHGDGSVGYPFADLAVAVAALRRRREPGEPARVWVAPGRYRMSEPLILGPQDSQTSFLALDEGDPPLLTGGVELGDWAEAEVNGATVWASPAPAARVRSLFAGGRRLARPRLPREGFFWIEEQAGLDLTATMVGTLFDGADEFRYRDGDVPPLSAPDEVEVVVPHYWIQERMPIAEVDAGARIIRTRWRSIFSLRDDAARRFARYYLENVVEAFGRRPGEWYHDVAGGRILYAPTPADERGRFTATAAATPQFAVVRGIAERQEIVRGIRFEGLRFAHADWREAPASRAPFEVREDPLLTDETAYAAAPQAAADVGAAIEFAGARGCAVVECSIEHVGGYAIDLGPGCRGNLISGNRFADLGAGAVKISGSPVRLSPAFTGDNEVSDNEAESGGRVYPQAVAVLARHTAGNVIAHNHIHDFFYTGISCGWVWGYEASVATDNLIAANHIHHLGQGLLNDMGGVYLLGVAPGTVVRGNLIHDVECVNYGGWGIYLDEGSSHVVVEGNVCHDVSSQCFHQHYGRENIVRHNVFAYGRQGGVAVGRPENHVGLTFERNIVLTDSVPAFCGEPGRRDVCRIGLVSDLNLFWDVSGAARRAGNGAKDAEMAWSLIETADEEWRAAGHDRHSVVADPRFADLDRRDFRLGADSPAAAVGVIPPDVSAVGPRPRADRPHPQARRSSALGIRPPAAP